MTRSNKQCGSGNAAASSANSSFDETPEAGLYEVGFIIDDDRPAPLRSLFERIEPTPVPLIDSTED